MCGTLRSVEPWLFALLVKPFIAACFFLLIWVVAYAFRRLLPPGKIKRALFTPLPWLRDTNRGRSALRDLRENPRDFGG